MIFILEFWRWPLLNLFAITIFKGHCSTDMNREYKFLNRLLSHFTKCQKMFLHPPLQKSLYYSLLITAKLEYRRIYHHWYSMIACNPQYPVILFTFSLHYMQWANLIGFASLLFGLIKHSSNEMLRPLNSLSLLFTWEGNWKIPITDLRCPNSHVPEMHWICFSYLNFCLLMNFLFSCSLLWHWWNSTHTESFQKPP